ncbi:MAG: 30S ribosomal protein S6 [Candidatus Solincola sediminis]|uniref:Small ribosomal subunit protein bS6 n=1 Tax=Candidatus Solincola sediminis TaxID=1797199 RepID=A0A1F2WR09_9ACTN|nr:MAG: 30S ribosomal protein S6 [Candidatus Solincola sediminis]OFW61113.1 MAG: 30S ribosomal protein S6 [Candidatus Solincola sediminis]
MREYELMSIARPNLEPEQYEAMQDRISKLITEGGGEITGLDIWGRRRLGYLIKHESDGYYVVLSFKGEDELIRELDRVLSISDDFLRFKIFRKGKQK